ncbi:hypothetical protein VIMS_02480 [Mycobacterium marinum]|uniref:hypothetical protein n=1 Tax=Mycobacterium marinum TaxID=1781 RepID=UPI000E3B96FF|nr:hypothetical protein [Mycobacterium marinum]RFZ15050.1 hypothetical protein VIMS_02480 [Mycobacterium marinum]
MLNPDRDIEIAKTLLEASGYVVLREKSYRQAQERQRIAEALRRDADEHRRTTQIWAQVTLHNEIRELQARCTALYGAARAHGATAEELAAIEWPTTGIVCPMCNKEHRELIERIGRAEL